MRFKLTDEYLGRKPMKRHILHDLFRNILMVVIVLLVTISAAGAATNRGLAVPNDTLPAELKGVPIQDSYVGVGVLRVTFL